jgi:hypothetical protein
MKKRRFVREDEVFVLAGVDERGPHNKIIKPL